MTSVAPLIFIIFNFSYHKPLFNLPIQDPFAQPLMRQHGKCGDLELKCLECIEYYGAHRGTIICQDYYDDWKECAGKNLSVRLNVKIIIIQK